MSKKLTWPSRLILTAVIAAAISFAPAASAVGDGHGHCPPGSTDNDYCQVFCVPPYVVGDHLGHAMRQIIKANCSVGAVTCIRPAGGAQSGQGGRGDNLGQWRWRRGRQWALYRRPSSWRSAGAQPNGRDPSRGSCPWNRGGLVIAQSPVAGGQYPAGTPIDLIVKFPPSH
jgi:hypothetical protein